MDNKLFTQYRFKFYLNASHSIIINGQQGQVHPHTWEMVLDILVPRDEFLEFNVYERAAEEFFNQFQDRTINDVPPFDTIVPTLENIVDYFGTEVRQIIRNTGGELMRIEGSETPTRSYIVSYTEESEYLTSVQNRSQESLARVVDSMLDRMLAQGVQDERKA